jgi:hypothetical protein
MTAGVGLRWHQDDRGVGLRSDQDDRGRRRAQPTRFQSQLASGPVPLPLASAPRISRRIPEPSGQPLEGLPRGTVNKSRNTLVLRSVEDLADAKDLRSAISAALTDAPINEHSLRCAVWSFVGTERRADVPAAEVISRLAALIDDVNITPISARHALMRQVILWCVEEYFGHLGGDALGSMISRQTADATGAL